MAPNQLVLSWKHHSDTLISVFENLLRKNTLVDCTLAAEGQYLKAHRMVLCACSSYFELLFSQESEKNPIVILKDVGFQELEAAVNFMYRGEVEVCEDRLAAFLEVAESLQIKGLGNYAKSQRSQEKSSTLSKKISKGKLPASPRHHSRKETLNSPSDSAGQSLNVPASCEADRNNENSAAHQSFRIESPCSFPAVPPLHFLNQSERNTQSDKDNFENSQSSLTALPQISSGENEHSVINSVIKSEPVDDTCGEEKIEDADMDFRDDLMKMEDQEDQVIGFTSEHMKTEDGTSEYSEGVLSGNQSSLEGSGAEYVVDPESPYKQLLTRSPTQFLDTGSTSRFTNISDTLTEPLASSLQSEEFAQPEAGKHMPFQNEKGFSSNLEFEEKMLLSKGKRVFKCSYCDHISGSQSKITIHLRTHTGERPYKCSYCTRKFSQQAHLTTHIRIHMADKPFQCPQCNLRFRERSSLTRHRRIHSGEKPYKCPECDFKASQTSSVTRHRLSRHRLDRHRL